MAARIVALVNRYDNLCNPHLLARAMTPHESLSLLFAQGRSKYDTSILGAFIKMMGVYPPGSTVQLTDDRYALVVAVNSSRPLKPNVLVHDAATPREEALVLDLETASGLGIRRSVPSRPTAADGARLPVAECARQLFLRASQPGRRRVNNPLPVDPFSVAEAARRTWPVADRGDARGGLPGRARGPAHRRRQRRRRAPARPATRRSWSGATCWRRRRRPRTRASGSASPTTAAAPTSSPTRTSRTPTARPSRWCAG